MSHLQILSPAAIDAEMEEAENSLATDAELFVGAHGGVAHRDAVEFKISYLETMKRIMNENNTPGAFVDAMKQAYPELPGENELEELGKVLYN